MDEYSIVKVLRGEANRGTFLLQEKKSTKEYVLDEFIFAVDVDEAKRDAARRLTSLVAVDHPNMVRLEEIAQDGDHLYVITEYCAGGTLRDRIDKQRRRGVPFETQLIRQWLAQMCTALRYLHDERNLAYGCAKPENWLLTANDQLKLMLTVKTDSRADGQHLLELSQLSYMAPELLTSNHCSKHCDMWSLGVILYELLTRKHPFEGKSSEELISKITSGKYPPLSLPEFEEYCILVKELLQIDTLKRPNANSILSRRSLWEEASSGSMKVAFKSSEVVKKSVLSKWYHEIILPRMVWKAAKDGELERIQQLLSELSKETAKRILETRIEDTLSQSTTALIGAASRGHMKVVEHLLTEYQVDIEQTGTTSSENFTFKGVTALWVAASEGQFDVVQCLASHGARIDALTETNSTPLRAACYNGKMEIVRFLVEHGAGVNLSKKDGSTSLMVAGQNGHIDVVTYLLEKGANVDVQDSDKGCTALHLASRKGPSEVIDLLLQAVPLHRRKDFVNQGTSDKTTPLMIAALHGQCEVVQYLLAAGADVDLQDDQGLTALFSAAQGGFCEIAELFIKSVPYSKRKRIVNTQSAKLDTCLMAACQNGHASIVALLLQYGADIFAKNDSGIMAIHLSENVNCSELLLRPLGPTKREGLVNRAADNGRTPLILACLRGNVDLIAYLIQMGADIEAETNDKVNALFAAAQEGYEAALELLLKYTAPTRRKTLVNNRNKRNYSAMMRASESGHANAVRCLLQFEAEVNVQDDWGYTALHYAAKNGHYSVMEILLDANARILVSTRDKHTALTLAARAGKTECVELLLTRRRFSTKKKEIAMRLLSKGDLTTLTT